MHAGVGTNRDSRRIAGYRSMTGGVRTTTATVHRPIYKAPKALASEALAAGQSWVIIKAFIRKNYVLSLYLNTDSESALIIIIYIINRG